MSAGNDNPFARWSRRKLAAREAEAPIPEEAKHAPEAVAAEEDAERGDLQALPREPDAAELSEPLPRLEDLTAESDLTAFLRKGVPGALRNTALRKMWSLDPVIRDYVGPAEYAWDFNKPGSMPGFGPLEAGKSVVNFLSKVAGSDPQDTAAESQLAPQQETIASSDEAAAASQDQPAEASAPTDPAQPEDPPETPLSEDSQRRAADAAAVLTEKTTTAGSSRTAAPSRHGGALPR